MTLSNLTAMAFNKKFSLHFLILILLALFIGLQYRLWFASGSYLELKQIHEKIAAQNTNNQDLKKRNRTLSAQIVNLQHNQESIEKIAREKLGMIKKGETFFLVPQGGTSQADE